MSNPKKSTKTETTLSVMNAIQHRRSVRDYTSQAIEKSVIHMLLDAAVLAPTAMHGRIIKASCPCWDES
jgi:hypothetical protein